MARKRRFGFRAGGFRRARKMSSGFSRKSKNLIGGAGKYIEAGAYGAVRSKMAGLVQPVTNMIPFGGTLRDNMALFLFDWIGAKVGRKIPWVSGVLHQGMIVEAAQMGQEITQGGLSGGIGNNNNNNGITFYG